MSDFRTPLSELLSTPQDAADGLNMGNVAPLPARSKIPGAANYAKDEQLVLRAKNEIWPLIDQSRRDRKGIEEDWMQIQRMSNMQHDGNQKYIGRSNAYLPVHAKNIITQNTALSRGLFPSDEYLDASVRSVTEMDKDKAIKAKHYMQYQFEKIAKARVHMKLYSRQLLDMGFSVLKFWYRKPQKYAKVKQGYTIPGLAAGLSLPDFATDTRDQGLTISARSIFNFYAFPFTAATLDECTLHFEDIQMSRAELTHFFKIGEWVNPYAMEAAPTMQDMQSANAELAWLKSAPPEAGEAKGTKLGDLRVVTEAYTFMELPASEYTEYDSPGCPLPVRIIFLGAEVVSIRRNTSFHQSSPFLGQSMNASPGFMLGYGPGKMIAPLQYLANDFINQTNDVCIYGLNPVVKAVPGKLIGGLRAMAPGTVWYMNELDAVDIIHPPTDQVQWGLQMAQLMLSMGQDFGGAPPIMQGTNAGKGAKTATSSQILQHNSQMPLQDLVEDIEQAVTIPLCEKFWKLAQQHAPDSVLARVFGVTREITRDDLQFDAEWEWKASSQSANAQQRASQVTSFLQALMPVIPLLQQSGIPINVRPILQKIWTDALGNRGFDDIIPPGTPPLASTMPGMPGAPGALPGGTPPEAVPGGRPRSALEQVAGGPGAGMDAASGEAEEFMDVRAHADELAAMMGGDGT